jgi:hypothetical protein
MFLFESKTEIIICVKEEYKCDNKEYNHNYPSYNNQIIFCLLCHLLKDTANI